MPSARGYPVSTTPASLNTSPPRAVSRSAGPWWWNGSPTSHHHQTGYDIEGLPRQLRPRSCAMAALAVGSPHPRGPHLHRRYRLEPGRATGRTRRVPGSAGTAVRVILASLAQREWRHPMPEVRRPSRHRHRDDRRGTRHPAVRVSRRARMAATNAHSPAGRGSRKTASASLTTTPARLRAPQPDRLSSPGSIPTCTV